MLRVRAELSPELLDFRLDLEKFQPTRELPEQRLVFPERFRIFRGDLHLRFENSLWLEGEKC